MADYSAEKGFTIQSLATDPYASEVLAATWSSGGNVNDVGWMGIGRRNSNSCFENYGLYYS